MNTTTDIMNMDLCQLRTSLVEGKVLNFIECALLRTFLVGCDSEQMSSIFKKIKDRSKLGTLKDDPEIKNVIEIIDKRLDDKANIIEFKKGTTPRTIMFGECFNAIVQGASGKDYGAEVISNVSSLITNHPDVVQQRRMALQEGVKEEEVNGLQCLMETGNTEMIHEVISATLASDTCKAQRAFESLEDLFNAIESENGFIIRTGKYTTVVYARGEDMVVKSTLSNDPTFIDTDPTLFDSLFR